MEKLKKNITALREKLSAMNTEYNQADKKSRELSEAAIIIEEYLRHEQSRGQQQKRKRNDRQIAPRILVILLRRPQAKGKLF